MYLGTSSRRAAYFLAAGWAESLPYTNLKEARRQAALHSLIDGGRGVVMTVSDEALTANKLDPSHLEVCELTPIGTSVVSRLGMEETAGLGDILSVLLDHLKVAHNQMVHAVSVGKGDRDAGVSGVFRDFDKEHPVRSLVGLHNNDWERRHRKKKKGANKSRWDDDDNDDDDDEPTKKQVPNLRTIKNAAKHSKYVHNVKRKVDAIGRVFHKLRKHVGKMFGGKNPQATDKPKRTRSAKKTVDSGEVRVAKRDVKVKVTVNGKPMTTLVHKGSRYRLVKSPQGLILKRRGGRGTVIVDPGDAGQL